MDASAPTQLILASSSPRRRDLLQRIGYAFRVIAPDVEETVLPGEDAQAHATRLAREKAAAVAASLKPADQACVVVAADTVVTCDGAILGKPGDAERARAMLVRLSGRTHEVITAVAARRGEREHFFAVATAVEMRGLTDRIIDAYIATGEPLDKAGAYAVQGGAAAMVRSVRGSYTNVVGLPLAELADLLAGEFGLTP